MAADRDPTAQLAALTARLRAAGCVAPEDEAAGLLAAATATRTSAPDPPDLEALVRRRIDGEPLAWITGRTSFAGLDLIVHPGVYVPRWQSETLAMRAAELLPPTGIAIDLCTGTGAIAAFLAHHHPGATIVATDIDPAAVANARANGVDAHLGDLDEPLRRTDHHLANADVITAVTPYVPTDVLALLAATREPPHTLDGGEHGTDLVERVLATAPHWLRPGGRAHVLLEIGAPQVDRVRSLADRHGFAEVDILRDPDGDVCGIAARYP